MIEDQKGQSRRKHDPFDLIIHELYNLSSWIQNSAKNQNIMSLPFIQKDA